MTIFDLQSGLLFKRGKLYEISPVEIESAKRSADEHMHIVKKSAEELIEQYSKFPIFEIINRLYLKV